MKTALDVLIERALEEALDLTPIAKPTKSPFLRKTPSVRLRAKGRRKPHAARLSPPTAASVAAPAPEAR